MKALLTVFALVYSCMSFAQTVDVKDVPGGGDEESTTTIEIKKGKKTDSTTVTTNAKWETQDGTADVQGDSAATAKEAKGTWKKACDDWKKEFRADNKENKIIAINCGTPSCGGDAGQKTCASKASYKIRTKIE
ncbi:MAG TPA: hypothetical protein PKC28_03950 [Bdellovibrionales bacterium]|nr:hypothetical protein [Bdellovibrionales bacterium]